MEYYHFTKLFLEFLPKLFWPLVTVIVFFNLKTPIINFIDKIKNLAYGDAKIEFNQANKQEEDKSNSLLNDKETGLNLDSILAKFSIHTLEKVERVIENETQISKTVDEKNKFDKIFKYSKLLVFIKSAEKIFLLNLRESNTVITKT